MPGGYAPAFKTTGIIETAWRHGKSESTPLLTKGFRRRTSRLNFFARITSAPMSYRFYVGGVVVLGTVWIPAAKSKRRSSAGACGSDLPAAFSGETTSAV